MDENRRSQKVDQNRRHFFGAAAITVAAAQLGTITFAAAQSGDGSSSGVSETKPGAHTSFGPIKQINAGLLDVGYAEAGPADGPVVILLHGWPYDIYSFVDVAPLLAAQGYRVIVPYLRGYGSTRFLLASTFRNGEQAAVALDVIALMDALKIKKAVIGGFDWGARTAAVIAALWPERCKALVSVSGYLIGSRKAAQAPFPPIAEHAFWYQCYFATDYGRAGYAKYTHDFGKLTWQLSPRNGTSTTPRSNGAQRRSTIPITSISSSTTTVGDSASPKAKRSMKNWNGSLPKVRRSRCRPSPWKATRTARFTRTQARMPVNSPAYTRIGRLPAASGTTRRKRRLKHLPTQSSPSIACDPRQAVARPTDKWCWRARAAGRPTGCT